MDKNQYPPSLDLLATAPLLMVLVLALLGPILPVAIIWVICGAILVVTGTAYYAQVTFLPEKYRPRVNNQLIFITAGFLVIFIAGVSGDYEGRVQYNDWGNYGSLLGLAIVSVFTGWLATYICVLGNVIFIATKGNSKDVELFGKIIRGICWFGIVVISFFAYTLAHSSHDPNLE